MKIPQIEISVKYTGNKSTELKKISSSHDTYDILKQMYSAENIYWTETLILICMNNRSKVIGYYKVSSGGTSGTVCDPKIIFTVALNCPGTTNIILSHNHPSGEVSPSNADNKLTARIKEAGKILDIILVDHVIYTENGYYSYADEGAM